MSNLNHNSAAGLVFGYTGQTVAISFGNLTDQGVLVGYRISGLDWQFTNITKGATHLLVSLETPGANLTDPVNPSTFELRVSNWGYGVQIDKVHVAHGEKLIKIPDHDRRVEVIGDSLSAGYGNTYESLSSFAYGLGAGLGNTEYDIIGYPGICAADQDCWGNPRGQVHQWFYTSDTRSQAMDIWGGRSLFILSTSAEYCFLQNHVTEAILNTLTKTFGILPDNPEPWDFSRHTPPDIVVINIGTNDQNEANNVSTDAYVDAYTKLVQGVHGKYPNANVILMVCVFCPPSSPTFLSPFIFLFLRPDTHIDPVISPCGLDSTKRATAMAPMLILASRRKSTLSTNISIRTSTWTIQSSTTE